MTDIFRRELDIPEKRTAFGWLLFAMGGIMILGAVIIFIQDTKLENLTVARHPAPPTNAPSATQSQAARSDKSMAAGEKAYRLLFMVVVAFGIVMAFVIIAGISHRAAERLRAPAPPPPAKPKVADPWQESANRLRIDSEKDE